MEPSETVGGGSMIDIENLTKHYGDLVAVDNLSLTVPAGEVFCFLGPNGAGKTTTIKIMTGLMRATSGRVRIAGIDVEENPLEAKKLVGYIPDMPFLYDRLTCREFFAFTGDLYDVPLGEGAAACEHYFNLFSLNEQRDTLVKELSHGMRQRLIYASTLQHNPRVLFIDEPLIGLDPYTIRLIKDLLVQRARGGMTIFLTTHILSLAEDIADRIGIILDGNLCALGSLDVLLQQHGGHDLESLFLKLTGRDALPGLEV
ncbi:MAG: ABC transporter ATP-binding protein [Verrucomicrobia bacterium]|nr:ABC transporter ATP-binding protein [Verrucomicrobiota bacterium]